MLIFPTHSAHAIFTLSPEPTDDEAWEIYKLEQQIKAEQFRDEVFNLVMKTNPYLTEQEIQTIIEKIDEETTPQVITRHYEKFQEMKDEQISLAEKKCKEILGGKIIVNDFVVKPSSKKHSKIFQIDNQTGFMSRHSDDFINYKLIQISIIEKYIENNWKNHQWELNPYADEEIVVEDSAMEENKAMVHNVDFRNSDEFKKLITEQLILAESTRNEMLESRITGLSNPYNDYEDDKIDMNLNQISNTEGDVTNKISINWINSTYVTGKPEFNALDRNSNDFEMIKTMELAIAQNKLNHLLKFSSMDEFKNDEIEKVRITQSDYKKPIVYERNDQGFEFFKNLEEDKAARKLLEILGGKDIHSIDYLKFEKIKLKSYSDRN